MVPEALAVLLVVGHIVDLIIIVIILDPLSPPKTVNDVLRLRGGKEDRGILVDGCFESVKGP